MPIIDYFADSLNKGEIWRLWTSKCAFLDTKDAIFCMILLYQFRIFERRFGSRKFASHLIAFMSLTGVLEWILTVCVQTLDSKLHSGLLSIGPWVYNLFSSHSLKSFFRISVLVLFFLGLCIIIKTFQVSIQPNFWAYVLVENSWLICLACKSFWAQLCLMALLLYPHW